MGCREKLTAIVLIKKYSNKMTANDIAIPEISALLMKRRFFLQKMVVNRLTIVQHDDSETLEPAAIKGKSLSNSLKAQGSVWKR